MTEVSPTGMGWWIPRKYGKVSSMYEDIIYEVSDPVATITLNRPASMNAWTNTMDNEIKDAIGRACADRSVVGIIITGAGPREPRQSRPVPRRQKQTAHLVRSTGISQGAFLT
jgi:hypothetical protein